MERLRDYKKVKNRWCQRRQGEILLEIWERESRRHNWSRLKLRENRKREVQNILGVLNSCRVQLELSDWVIIGKAHKSLDVLPHCGGWLRLVDVSDVRTQGPFFSKRIRALAFTLACLYFIKFMDEKRGSKGSSSRRLYLDGIRVEGGESFGDKEHSNR